VDRLGHLTMIVCTLLLMTVVGLSAAEIIARSFFAASSVEMVDLSLQLAILMYFAGYLVLLNDDQDIAIDYFYRRLPAAARRVIDVCAGLAIAAFFLLLFVKSIAMFRMGLRYNHPVFPIPNAVVALPAVIGSLGGLIVAVRKALDILVGKGQGEARASVMPD
jgi:TRAP-type C4-dicarboxylate transport system permease small subunit